MAPVSANRHPLLIAVVVCLAGLGACALEDGSHLTEAASPSPAPDDQPPSTAPPGTAGPVGYTENACPFDADGVDVTCGSLVVPRDRGQPEEGTISVAVARLHATGRGPRPDPIVYFEGGPGGASLTFASWWAGHPLLRDRDIILFDQRGTGYSEPNLACDDEFVDAGDDEGNDVDLYRSCYERLAATTDLSDFTTVESAHDVADLIDALGLDEVNLLGISYGTRLAMVTMDIAPDPVRSVVLDSVYPPGVEALELLAANASGAFGELYEACADDADCRGLAPDLEEVLHQAVDTLDEHPIEVQFVDAYSGDRVPYDAVGIDLVDAVFSALYDNLLIKDTPRAIVLAGSGDQEQVQEAFDLLYGEEPYEPERRTTRSSGHGPGAASAARADEDDPPEDSDGLYYSVTCSEELPMTTLDDVRAASESVEPELRDELRSGADYDIEVCKVWDAGQTIAAPLEPVASALPTLLLSGRFDPITPASWAREAAERLTNSHAYVLDGAGHGVMDSQLCGMELVRSFLDDPTRAPDASCVDQTDPPDFEVD
jgi:pimeloyl-ACP methyl ester carboxylesterase